VAVAVALAQESAPQRRALRQPVVLAVAARPGPGLAARAAPVPGAPHVRD